MRIVLYKNTTFVQPYWFVIWSGSNKLAHSEMYKQKSSAIDAIVSIMRNINTADYKDATGEV